jgi:steroid 5-alpha reductase family enzyme
MSFLYVYGVGLALILGVMTLLWLVSLRLENASIVDIFWGTGFVIANWLYFALTPEGFLLRKLLISTLVTIWGLRLSIHILLRNWGKPEDFRYQNWRKEAGSKWVWLSFFRVFLLQGILLWLISAPLLAAQSGVLPGSLTVFDALGIVVWLIGFFFESMGDFQLARFKTNPANKGKVLNTGVWRYTRHPNYFGDSAQWWGFYLVAVSAGSWWTLFSPIIMTIFLLRVSGVALLEKTLETRPGYKEYIEQTSPFIPWWPRRK